ncbi:hypothetical protein Bbelb_310160 [Branchiostoma belcheri]|nr:hypothetical protein Bbelb_310160 [Branchiostoma belcheri]
MEKTYRFRTHNSSTKTTWNHKYLGYLARTRVIDSKDDTTESDVMEVHDTEVIRNWEDADGKTFKRQERTESAKPPLVQKESAESTGVSTQAGLPSEGDELEELYENRKAAVFCDFCEPKIGIVDEPCGDPAVGEHSTRWRPAIDTEKQRLAFDYTDYKGRRRRA